MRLIDADALKRTLKNLKAEGNNKKYVQGLQNAIDDYFPQIIDDEPTINPIKEMNYNNMLESIKDQLFSLLDELEDMKQLTESKKDFKKLIGDSYEEAFHRGLYSGLQIAIMKIKITLTIFDLR